MPVKETQLEPVPQVQRQKIVQEAESVKGSRFTTLKVGQLVLMQDLKAKRTEWQRGVCQGSQPEWKPTVSEEEPISEQLMEGQSEQECEVKQDQRSGEQDQGNKQDQGSSRGVTCTHSEKVQRAREPQAPTSYRTRSGRSIKKPIQFSDFVEH